MTRRGRIGCGRARRKDPRQNGSKRIEQTYEAECEHDVERHVELGGHLCHVGLEAAKAIGKWIEKRREQGDARYSVEQIPDRQTIARRVTAQGTFEQRI